ncbi:hypothetical protein Lal_00045757 [Lupinus albus]|nr:hypothetical protein Lal_00045757 [Lupinus albus]
MSRVVVVCDGEILEEVVEGNWKRERESVMRRRKGGLRLKAIVSVTLSFLSSQTDILFSRVGSFYGHNVSGWKVIIKRTN